MSEETEYRIEFTIQRRTPADSDFIEIGFGSSGAWSGLEACTHMIGSAIAHGEWETESGHPDPARVMADIKAGVR